MNPPIANDAIHTAGPFLATLNGKRSTSSLPDNPLQEPLPPPPVTSVRIYIARICKDNIQASIKTLLKTCTRLGNGNAAASLNNLGLQDCNPSDFNQQSLFLLLLLKRDTSTGTNSPSCYLGDKKEEDTEEQLITILKVAHDTSTSTFAHFEPIDNQHYYHVSRTDHGIDIEPILVAQSPHYSKSILLTFEELEVTRRHKKKYSLSDYDYHRKPFAFGLKFENAYEKYLFHRFLKSISNLVSSLAGNNMKNGHTHSRPKMESSLKACQKRNYLSISKAKADESKIVVTVSQSRLQIVKSNMDKSLLVSPMMERNGNDEQYQYSSIPMPPLENHPPCTAGVDDEEKENIPHAGHEKDDNFFCFLVPDDRKKLSDYMFLLLAQIKKGHLTGKDIDTSRRRNSKLPLGYPGMRCRHCGGIEKGHYFPSSCKNLQASPVMISKHLLKCDHCPLPIKTALKSLKSQHKKQVSLMKNGTQVAFFNRLWQRIHDVKFDGENLDKNLTIKGMVKDVLGRNQNNGRRGFDKTEANKMSKSENGVRNKKQFKKRRTFSSPCSLDIVMEVLKEARTPDLCRQRSLSKATTEVSKRDEMDTRSNSKKIELFSERCFDDGLTSPSCNTIDEKPKQQISTDCDKLLYGETYWNTASLRQLQQYVDSDPFMMESMELLLNLT